MSNFIKHKFYLCKCRLVIDSVFFIVIFNFIRYLALLSTCTCQQSHKNVSFTLTAYYIVANKFIRLKAHIQYPQRDNNKGQRVEPLKLFRYWCYEYVKPITVGSFCSSQKSSCSCPYTYSPS